jgi:hypothetical protein
MHELAYVRELRPQLRKKIRGAVAWRVAETGRVRWSGWVFRGRVYLHVI